VIARVLFSKDLVVVSPEGRLDLEASETAIERLIADLENDPGSAVIFDLRSAECELSVAEIYGLVEFLSRHGSRQTLYRKMAVLLAADAHQRKADFFALCARNRGLQARAFSTVTDINDWLGTDVSAVLDSA